MSAFRIPEGDRDVVLDLYGEARRIVPAGRSDRYTRVEIVGIAARSTEAKRALYRAIVDNLERLGVPPLESRIVMIEPPAENWGIKGGIPASQVELGFRIDV
ncbi:tautomerase family protein [Falsiroseomonas sp. E2-1-a4]|uniref:tautomerase family protein n=1 Tax=Falsiroseomonas sp. E2-1-a4 TaxID=3239299 RepID=UPI003F32E463